MHRENIKNKVPYVLCGGQTHTPIHTHTHTPTHTHTRAHTHTHTHTRTKSQTKKTTNRTDGAARTRAGVTHTSKQVSWQTGYYANIFNACNSFATARYPHHVRTCPHDRVGDFGGVPLGVVLEKGPFVFKDSLRLVSLS